MSDDRLASVAEPYVAAARWWAQWLTRPAPFDNGDDSPNGGVAAAMDALTRPSQTVTDEQVEAFTSELATRIQERTLAHWTPGEPRFGSVLRQLFADYGPPPIVRDAAQAANLNWRGVFPVKTCMEVSPERVSVGNVYRGEVETVWPEPS